MMPSDNRVRAAYAECRRLARRHYENFPVASYLVPRAQRAALAAIYAFARGADDFADEPVSRRASNRGAALAQCRRNNQDGARQFPPAGERSSQSRLECLAEWRRKLGECYAGESDHVVFIALGDAVRKFSLSREHFENLLRAFELDVKVSRHLDFSSLLAYCSHSANPVGRLVLELFGHRDPALFDFSDNVCTALQLTNFWQDVRVDLERDRIYLPLEDLNRFDLKQEDLLALMSSAEGRADERWTRLMTFEVERTRQLFEQGESLLERVAPNLRRQLRLTWLGGMEILSKIESVGYDVFRRRPTLGRLHFARLFLQSRSALQGRPRVRTSTAPAAARPARAGAARPKNLQATNFYYSFLFLPREKRRALEAVYAFARRADDLVDGNLAPLDAARQIGRCRRTLDDCYAKSGFQASGPGAESDDPDLNALAEALRRFKIPRQYFQDLILGLEMDLRMDAGSVRYDTFDDLAVYCYRVAGAIGLISIEIFGYRNPRARDYALNLGTALQLVNILRDLRSDARRGRVYLPREDLDRFGVRPEDLAEGRSSGAQAELVQFECARARRFFDLARKSLAEEDRRSMVAAEIMAAIYFRLLRRIEQRGCNVLGERVRLSRPLKFWTALSVYLGVEWSK